MKEATLLYRRPISTGSESEFICDAWCSAVEHFVSAGIGFPLGTDPDSFRLICGLEQFDEEAQDADDLRKSWQPSYRWARIQALVSVDREIPEGLRRAANGRITPISI